MRNSIYHQLIKSVAFLDLNWKGPSVAYRERQGICLQDCGSTHGTHVGGQRLQPHKDHILSNDETVTFGVRVTSGARKSQLGNCCRFIAHEIH